MSYEYVARTYKANELGLQFSSVQFSFVAWHRSLRYAPKLTQLHHIFKLTQRTVYRIKSRQILVTIKIVGNQLNM